MNKPIKHLPLKLRVAHVSANLSYAALLAVLTLWTFLRTTGFSPALWAIVCLPLLILWPGMRKKGHRAYSWLCFVILLYFIKAVESSMSSTASWTDFITLALTVIIFVSAMLTSRYLQRAQTQSSDASTLTTDKELP